VTEKWHEAEEPIRFQQLHRLPNSVQLRMRTHFLSKPTLRKRLLPQGIWSSWRPIRSYRKRIAAEQWPWVQPHINSRPPWQSSPAISSFCLLLNLGRLMSASNRFCKSRNITARACNSTSRISSVTALSKPEADTEICRRGFERLSLGTLHL